MTAIPPPYAPRDYAQVQPGPSNPASSSSHLEFAETATVTLEWRLTGLKNMYDTTKGDAKSKCVKSAVFGDPDNLWEVLWYANSGVQGGEYVSLYLSCVPTQEERDSCLGGKWKRKGLWWFRFEIRSTQADDRTLKPVILATKDASDHTFAVKTANWGWQQFAKRDQLFVNPHVLAADSFTIVCTIQAQPQPPAGYWLGVGLRPRDPTTQPQAVTAVQGRDVGSGGGLSAWAGGEGAAGGVAGGTAAGGGPKRVVPTDLVSAVGDMLDDPLYSDVEFIIPPRQGSSYMDVRTPGRRIFANKKLLSRCEYFEAMFDGGFGDDEGVIEHWDDEEDEDDYLSDSDVEDELPPRKASRTDLGQQSPARPPSSLPADTPTAAASSAATAPAPRTSSESATSDNANANGTTQAAPGGSSSPVRRGHDDNGNKDIDGEANDQDGDASMTGEGSRNSGVKDRPAPAATSTVTSATQARSSAATDPSPVLGPRKTKVMIRDAAWSTWWAILYWIYTDTIHFAPLSSSFDKRKKPGSATSGDAATSGATATDADDGPKSRREWINEWLSKRDVRVEPPEWTLSNGPAPGPTDSGMRSLWAAPYGPRPVSAKSVYRLADKLDLPALKLRAFQHICGELTSDNIPAEVFGRFASTFEDVRKVEVAFFLKNWSTLKKSETMARIWPQMRAGKHVGLEEVWPLILSQLEFKPS